MQWSFKYTKVKPSSAAVCLCWVVGDIWLILLCTYRKLPIGPSWSHRLCIRLLTIGKPWSSKMHWLPNALMNPLLHGTSYMKRSESILENFIRWSSRSRALRRRKPNSRNNYRLLKPVGTWSLSWQCFTNDWIIIEMSFYQVLQVTILD